jgi:hypothetical protein
MPMTTTDRSWRSLKRGVEVGPAGTALSRNDPAGTTSSEAGDHTASAQPGR